MYKYVLQEIISKYFALSQLPPQSSGFKLENE
jgi:hypothetical protein